jgi:hypothetical protein
MEEKAKEEVKEKKGVRDFRYYSVQALILLAVVTLGVFAVNQVLEYRYNSVLLQAPCKICTDLNPKIAPCLEGCFNYRIEAGASPLTVDLTNFTRP